MKLRLLLKTSLMLGLVIAGRYARDVEQTNPGRSFNEILRISASTTPATLPTALPVAARQLQSRLPRPISSVLPAQTASFADVN